MIVIAGALIGAIFGALTAKRNKGSLADILQYAAGYGIALALVGMVATIIIHRAAV
ncbi:apolipoprotein acyltransferase [Arenibacterium sp. CAU 1754]